MKIAAIQMVSGHARRRQPRGGRARCWPQAAAEGCELAVLPEYFCLMGRRGHRQAGAARAGRRRADPGASWPTRARELGLWIVGGTLPLVAGDAGARAQHQPGVLAARRVRGALRQDPPVPLRQRPRALRRGPRHRAGHRSRWPSSCRRATGTRWRVGMSVCYDLRFPELYRRPARRPAAGAQRLHPRHRPGALGAAAARPRHREPGLRGGAGAGRRARERPPHLGPQRWWSIPGARCWRERRDEGEGVVVATLDAERLAQVRRQLPALEHRVL